MDDGVGHSATATARDERLTRLFDELHVEWTDSARPTDTADGRVEDLLDRLEATLSPEGEFHFDDGVVKQSLDEMLVVLIALRSRDANGKALMEDLEQLFDSDLSPGSVYPRLHELADDGTLEMFELVHSKEYRVDDRERAASMAAAAARQHLAVGAFLQAAASEL